MVVPAVVRARALVASAVVARVGPVVVRARALVDLVAAMLVLAVVRALARVPVVVPARALVARAVAARAGPVVVQAQALTAAMLVLAAPAQTPVAWATVPADPATAMAPAMVMEAAKEERAGGSTDLEVARANLA